MSVRLSTEQFEKIERALADHTRVMREISTSLSWACLWVFMLFMASCSGNLN